jgi:hypothetical protein
VIQQYVICLIAMIRSGVSLSQEIVPIDETSVANGRMPVSSAAAAAAKRVCATYSVALPQGGVGADRISNRRTKRS